MKIKTVLLIIVSLILVGVLGYYFYPKQKQVAPHFHAGFYVYIDGQLQDFSDTQYMHTTYCVLDSTQTNGTPNQIEKAHLHDGVGDVIHIHSKGVKWIDLFDSIDYHFPTGKPTVGYKEGHEVKDVLNQIVLPYESIIIAVGETKNINLNKYVTLSHIKEVESKSEYCGKQ